MGAVIGIWSRAIPAEARVLLAVVCAVVWLAASGSAAAAERDLYSGLAYLRAGAQGQAEEYLTKYRDEERDPENRRTVGRVLPLLKRPLSEEVREYLAATIEEGVRLRPATRAEGARPNYWFRMFPVFP